MLSTVLNHHPNRALAHLRGVALRRLLRFHDLTLSRVEVSGKPGAVQSSELAAAFEKHQTETEGHVSRLEEVFSIIGKKPQGKTCAAIVGITDEGAEIMEEYEGSPALDAGLLAAAQAVEHYEISRYGTMRTWAEELGLDEAVSLLDATLEEEKATDEALTELAESAVNQEAA